MLLDRNKSLLNYAVMYGQAKPQQTPSVEKHAHPPRVVYCAIYPTLTCLTKFRVSNLHITSTPDAANTCTLHQRILPREAIPSHYFPLGNYMGKAWETPVWQLSSSHRCHQMQRTAEPNHSKPRRWKSMLTHQVWFTALFTQRLLALQSFEFLICILLALQMPLIHVRCTNVFYQGRLSRHYAKQLGDQRRVLRRSKECISAF